MDAEGMPGLDIQSDLYDILCYSFSTTVIRSELEFLTKKISRTAVAVVGDFCLDAYWFFDHSAAETSVETGLTTRPVARQRYTAGGAGNVVNNLRSLGVETIIPIGVIGDDPFGHHLRSLLSGEHIDLSGLLVQHEGWHTHVYAKPHTNDVEEQRIDFGNFNRLDGSTARALTEEVRRAVSRTRCIIINEQVYQGIHASAQFQQALQEIILDSPNVTFMLDSRHMSDRYRGTTRKVNDTDAAGILGVPRTQEGRSGEREALNFAEALFKRWSAPVIITRGEHGCVGCDETGAWSVPGIPAHGPTDPVGAGDSLVAAVGAALAAGSTLRLGTELGVLAAAVTVRKLHQTGTASPDELLDLLHTHDDGP
jgi:bifunctional ADP-heptose synthase (sugar kinase/adenylyltransferase)